jgi:hypothetical protein
MGKLWLNKDYGTLASLTLECQIFVQLAPGLIDIPSDSLVWRNIVDF